MIRDTEEYKQLAQLRELHDAYKKHVPTEPPPYGYNTFERCKICGLTYDATSGVVTPLLLNEQVSSYKSGYNVDYEQQSDAEYVYCVDQVLAAKTIPVCELITGKLQRLQGDINIKAFRRALIKNNDPSCNLTRLYLYATQIDKQPSPDIYAILCKQIAQSNYDYKLTSTAALVLAWHTHFNIKPDRALFKNVVTMFNGDEEVLRTFWSRAAGTVMATSTRFHSLRSSVYAYQLVKDIDTKRFNDIEYMRKTFHTSPIAIIMYYRDTGRLIFQLTGLDMAIKSRLVDKCIEPTDDDRKLIGDIYPIIYGTRLIKLARVHELSHDINRLQLCEDLDEYLLGAYGFTVESARSWCNEFDGLYGFGGASKHNLPINMHSYVS